MLLYNKPTRTFHKNSTSICKHQQSGETMMTFKNKKKQHEESATQWQFVKKWQQLTAPLWINTGRYQQFRWNDFHGEIRPDWKKVNYRVRIHGCGHTVWKTRVSKTRVCKTRMSKTRMFKTRVCKTQVCKTTGIESTGIKRIADLNTNAYPYRVFQLAKLYFNVLLFAFALPPKPIP